MRLSGTVRFPPSEGGLKVGALRVAIRDVSDFDAPALTVASVTLGPLDVPAAGQDVPFSVDADLERGPGRRTYEARAHADRSGSGEVDPGDLVTTSANFVDPDHPWPLELVLFPVGI